MKTSPKPKLTFEQFRIGIKKHSAKLRASRKAYKERDVELSPAVEKALAEDNELADE